MARGTVEFYIPLTAQGCDSAGSAITFERTRTSLNTSEWDSGASFFFEIYAYNTEVSDRTVSLVNSAGGGTGGVITVTNSTSSPTRYREAFTPSGSDSYRVKTGASGGGVVVLDAWIVVQVTNPTKCALYYPLINMTDSVHTSGDTTGYADTTNSTTYTQPTTQYYPYYFKNTDQLETISSWSFEAVLASDNAAGTSTLGLHDSSGNLVTGGEVSRGGTTPVLVTMAVSNSATNFSGDLEVKLKTSNALYGARVYHAYLKCVITSLKKVEILRRITRQISQNFSDDRDNSRWYYDADKLQFCKFYYEATGKQDVSGSQSSNLTSRGAVDTGGTATGVSGATVSFSGTSKERVRSSEFTSLVDEDRHTFSHVVTTGTINTYAASVVIHYTAPAEGGNLPMLGVG